MNNSILFGQESMLLRGVVYNAVDSSKLAYASILLTKSLIGTVADSSAFFQLFISKKARQEDTLKISYLGFYPAQINMSQMNDTIAVYLEPHFVNINDFLAKNTSAEEYIKSAVSSAYDNYDQRPFNLVSYVEGNMYEDKRLLVGAENVFKTYYHYEGFNSDEKKYEENHQLLLYRTKNHTAELRFMRKEILEKQRKSKDAYQKALQDTNFLIKFVPFIIPIYSTAFPFLDSNEFGHFNYTITQGCTKNNIMIIEYKTKKAFKYEQYAKVAGKGNIYIDCQDNAIVKMDIDMKLTVSFLARTTLWLWFNKINVKDVFIRGDIQYKRTNKYYYPHQSIFWSKAHVSKTRWFARNDKADFELIYSMITNKVILDNVQNIPQEKRYSFQELSVQNDMNIRWEDVKKMGAELYK